MKTKIAAVMLIVAMSLSPLSLHAETKAQCISNCNTVYNQLVDACNTAGDDVGRWTGSLCAISMFFAFAPGCAPALGTAIGFTSCRAAAAAFLVACKLGCPNE